MSEINYRRQWAEGEIEAGTLLDAIDALAQRCRELEANNKAGAQWMEKATSALRSEEADNDALRTEVADLKASLLEAERGNEELVRLRAERRTLRVALARIADRAEAFVSDDASMKPHSAGAVAMIARKALEASHDEG